MPRINRKISRAERRKLMFDYKLKYVQGGQFGRGFFACLSGIDQGILKRREIKMARNLIQEKRDEERKAKAEPKKKEEPVPVENEKEIIYVTTEQVTLNNLNVIMDQLFLIMKGLKKAGIDVEELKRE
jgi:hypothetical protein